VFKWVDSLKRVFWVSWRARFKMRFLGVCQPIPDHVAHSRPCTNTTRRNISRYSTTNFGTKYDIAGAVEFSKKERAYRFSSIRRTSVLCRLV